MGELYLSPARELRVFVAGGLTGSTFALESGYTVPNDGSTVRVELSLLKNADVTVRVNGNQVATTTINGGNGGNWRTLRAGIDHYDTSSSETVTITHTQVGVTSSGWLGTRTSSSGPTPPANTALPTTSCSAQQGQTLTALERYTGRWDKKLDTTSNLIEMGARPYDPTTGRFLSVDPIEGGSLNNYDYAGQDPINGFDLEGQRCWSLSCAKKAVAKAIKASRRAGGEALQLGQEAPYGLYFVSYKALGATGTRSRAFNVALDLVTPRGHLVVLQAIGLGGNAAFNLARRKSNFDDGRRDSALPNFIARRWNPSWLIWYLPGGKTVNGKRSVDFRL